MNNIHAFQTAALAVAFALPVLADEQPAAAAPQESPAAAAAEAPSEATRAVAIRINGEDVVFEDELDSLLESVFAARNAQSPVPQEYELMARAQLRRGVIDQLVLTTLLERKATEAGFTVSDADRAEMLEAINVKSLDEAVKLTGMPLELIERTVLVNKFVTSQTNNVAAPTDEEIRARFDQIVAQNPSATNVPERVRASHILVKVDANASEKDKTAAKEKIDSLRARAVAGEDFAALAKDNSDCPSSARGGDLGEFGHGQMVSEFDAAAFSQPIGEIGEPVKTKFGWHIIKVTEKTDAKSITFDDVKDEIASGLRMEATRNAINDFVRSVRDAAKVEIVADSVVSDPLEVPEEPATPQRRLPEWAE